MLVGLANRCAGFGRSLRACAIWAGAVPVWPDDDP
jgi:hypothetical protein